MKPINVKFINRSSGRFWSIEELFKSIAAAFPKWVRITVEKAPCDRASPRSILSNLLWLRAIKGCDLIHQTGDIHYAILGVGGRPTILTIHDIRFIEEAKGIRRFLFLCLWLKLPCRKARKVTVISGFTKERLLNLVRIDQEKIVVIPNCVGEEFKAKPKPWPLEKVHVLQVGTTSNKNFDRVVEVCSNLEIKLSILGRLSSGQKELLYRSAFEFEEYSNLSRQEVVELYEACDVVIFVSTYEGFGMPIIEAQAVGRPVLTSNIAPMKVVAGEGALKVDPFDTNSIREGLQKLLSDSRLRKSLVEKGFENVKQYSAKSVATQYAEVYREVIQEYDR